MVLWLAAALAAIALAVATTVRSETERTTTAVESLKAYYLATGAIERTMLYLRWTSYRNPDGSPRFYDGSPRILLQFPTGQAVVDIIPETAKLNVNTAPPEQLYRLLVTLGAGPDRAQEIVAAILDWRTPQPGGALALGDQFYSGQNPSFPARHASLEEIEELLLVKGMTPELFYGGFERDAQGRLKPRPGVKDCLSVYGSMGAVDVNTAEPAVLAAVGLPPEAVAAVAQARRHMPFRTAEQLNVFGSGLPGFDRLRIGGYLMFTLRATARLSGPAGAPSETSRSVAALIRFMDQREYAEPYHVLRWYDNVWVQ
jgi:general secretion pathway protein K